MDILKQVLDGREQRVEKQGILLQEGGLVVQVALNVPGFPKRIEGDEKVLLKAMDLFSSSFGTEGRVASPFRLDNGAGLAFLLAYRGRDPVQAKRCAVEVETEQPWGRTLDMDILTPCGSLSRKDLGLPPRRCLLCEREAKVCSRLGAHEIRDLRLVLADLLSSAS